MEAKFYFDGPEVIDMIAQCLRRQFENHAIEVDGYIEDGAASVTVKFSEMRLTPATK